MIFIIMLFNVNKSTLIYIMLISNRPVAVRHKKKEATSWNNTFRSSSRLSNT